VRDDVILDAVIHLAGDNTTIQQVQLGAIGPEANNASGPTARHSGHLQELVNGSVIDVDPRLSRRCIRRCCVQPVGFLIPGLRRHHSAHTQQSNRQRRKSYRISHRTILAFNLEIAQMRLSRLASFGQPSGLSCKNGCMEVSPVISTRAGSAMLRIFGRTRLVFILALMSLLVVCGIFSWVTRDAMAHMPFLKRSGGAKSAAAAKALVDLRPWLTAQALAPLAVTAEETEYARDAERLADHEVDQAFASALRKAGMEAQHRTLTGEALALSQRVAQLQDLVNEDQAQVKRLTSASGIPAGKDKEAGQPVDDDDLDIAKAQLGLDSDQLTDLQQDLDRASGDDRSQIQAELTAHEALMKEYDSQSHGDGQIAVIAAGQRGTLARRLSSWNSQRDRNRLIEQAWQQAQLDIASITATHNALEAKANATTTGDASDRAAKLANIKGRSAERQLLSIYDDRIQTEQQLAITYRKWSNQVLLQHRILFHLILRSLELIVFILICMVLGDALVRRFLGHRSQDRSQMRTLRTILEVGIQVVGVVLILIVIFGWPQQTSTILGLATAGLTIALQDFILAFFGWFALMGKNGIRVGDWVEINGVGGEVTEIGLFYTTLLETGSLEDRGHPTGRRITFVNSFAIRGQYFNFSTTGQWMWDEITVSIAASDDTHAMIERIQEVVRMETEQSASIAEQEWKRGERGDGLSLFSATPVVNLRPSKSGTDIQVRYVTRASGRFDVRNRLYQQVIDLLHEKDAPAATERAPVVEKA
jgi:small-conductance mechanosensitive channel